MQESLPNSLPAQAMILVGIAFSAAQKAMNAGRQEMKFRI